MFGFLDEKKTLRITTPGERFGVFRHFAGETSSNHVKG